MNEKTKRIYAYQYGQYWSFSKENMIKALEKAAKENGSINLDDYGKTIKNQPSTVRLDSNGYPYSISSKSAVIMPLDWEKSDFEFVLDQLAR